MVGLTEEAPSDQRIETARKWILRVQDIEANAMVLAALANNG